MGLIVYFTFASTIFLHFYKGGATFSGGMQISLRGVRTSPLNPAMIIVKGECRLVALPATYIKLIEMGTKNFRTKLSNGSGEGACRLWLLTGSRVRMPLKSADWLVE